MGDPPHVHFFSNSRPAGHTFSSPQHADGRSFVSPGPRRQFPQEAAYSLFKAASPNIAVGRVAVPIAATRTKTAVAMAAKRDDTTQTRRHSTECARSLPRQADRQRWQGPSGRLTAIANCTAITTTYSGNRAHARRTTHQHAQSATGVTAPAGQQPVSVALAPTPPPNATLATPAFESSSFFQRSATSPIQASISSSATRRHFRWRGGRPQDRCGDNRGALLRHRSRSAEARRHSVGAVSYGLSRTRRLQPLRWAERVLRIPGGV